MTALDECVAELVDANRILVRQGLVDAYGHVSARHPGDPERFLLSRNLAPGRVTAADVQVYDLDAITADPRPGYLERFLHAEMYRAHPRVMAVVHSHAASFLPFGVSGRALQAIWHMASFLGTRVPVFEIREAAGESSDLLIRNRNLGAALAASLGDSAAALMRGHGAVVVGDSIPHAVHRAIYAELNARALMAAIGLGEVTALTAGEAAAADAANRGQVARAWDIWRTEIAQSWSPLDRDRAPGTA